MCASGVVDEEPVPRVASPKNHIEYCLTRLTCRPLPVSASPAGPTSGRSTAMLWRTTRRGKASLVTRVSGGARAASQPHVAAALLLSL